jgi:uncharacterized protein YciI
MPIFVVDYQYGAPANQLDEIRPIHRAWVAELHQQGVLLAAGPMVANPEALLIFKAESAAELSALLDHDPFDIAGFIESRSIKQWNQVFGPFSA